MKFSIYSNDLIASLNILAKVQKKGVGTAISSIKFTINEDGTIHLSANDGDMEIFTKLTALDTEAGSFCVNSEQFSKMIKGIINQRITLTCDDNTFAIVIKYNTGKFKMVGSSADNYIGMNFAERNEKGVMVDSESLLMALNKTKVCVAEKDVLRPVFSAIHFDFDNNGMSVVGTDSHKLMYCFKNYESDIELQSMNMPLKAADVISSVISQYNNESTTFYINEDNVEIECGAYIIKSRLLDGNYPNYKSVIPHDNDIQIEFNRKGLIAALKRVVGFTDTTSNLVKIVSVPDKCYYLSSENDDLALSAKEMVETNTPTQDFTIGFNGLDLLSILSTFDDETIVINAKSADRPILIKSDEGLHSECILMPLRINE